MQNNLHISYIFSNFAKDKITLLTGGDITTPLPNTLTNMDTTNINAIINNGEKVSIEEALNKTLDQLICSKFISSNNIINQYSHSSMDESKTEVLTILPPTESNPEMDILNSDNIWKELLNLIGEYTKCTYLFQEYQQFIYNETESLQLSYNDETIDIIYHYTGQW